MNMKKVILIYLLLLLIFPFGLKSQQNNEGEKFGRTLNLGLGLGYYGYVGSTIPVLHANFEFDVTKNFTLAPFITFYSYQKYYYWGNSNNPYRNYSYRQSVVPIGVKASYYFDQFLKAGENWDFYAAGSLGFVIRRTVWENGYYGQTEVKQGTSALYLDAHLGTEYHFNKKIGLLLDLSTGVSTIGLGIHL
jgi:hypothetical protein